MRNTDIGVDPEIEIEKGIPFMRRRNYPFKKMKVGESFFIPSATPRTAQSSIAAVARRDFRERKFSTAIIRTGPQTGVRCWRVA